MATDSDAAGGDGTLVHDCAKHQIQVIAGACPMMYGPGADFAHRCMRWMLKLTGGLPK
jgi:uncharacterized protein